MTQLQTRLVEISYRLANARSSGGSTKQRRMHAAYIEDVGTLLAIVDRFAVSLQAKLLVHCARGENAEADLIRKVMAEADKIAECK